MVEPSNPPKHVARRNVGATAACSFLTDISSEMVLHLVPLYLMALGVGVHWIGWIEGVAKSLTGGLKLFSGRWSDRLGRRKWPAVLGYGMSALAKPFFMVVETAIGVAAVRWGERIGKGLRTAPRDALLADSAPEDRRGRVFGFHRAADTLGAAIGLGLAMFLLSRSQGASVGLEPEAFRLLVAWSLVPAFLAVVVLAAVAEDVPVAGRRGSSSEGSDTLSWRRLGRPFLIFLTIVALFDLGDSSDAFLILKASEHGVSTVGVLALLLLFNLVYAGLSTPAGALSDRLGRSSVLAMGWTVYGAVYFSLARLGPGDSLWPYFALYGVYYGLSHGTAKAMVADLVPERLRGTAFGLVHGVLALMDLPASVLAGGLWQLWGSSAPFYFSAGTAWLAVLLLVIWRIQDPVRP